ncbi:MAG: hypothetical protein JJE41_14730 [Candidatus Heimdallarchaeota archaeon]|nr:hypothetical protein [Candidatus Heimdallarchaeota archaeon]
MTVTNNFGLPINDFRLNKFDFKISENAQFLLNFLVDYFIIHSQLVIPSVKYLDDLFKSFISVRTTQRVINILTNLKILQKCPRSTTQPLALDINNCLLRFILTISQPKLDIKKQIQNQLAEKLDDSFLQQITTSRKHLEDIIENVTNEQETVKELSEEFLDKFPVSIIDESSPESLNIEMAEYIDRFVGEELLSLPEHLEELLPNQE